MKLISDTRLLLLGIWLGAACFFIAVAQSAFAVLPSRELAGAVVNRTLSVLNYAGIAISVILILTSFIPGAAGKIRIWSERILLFLVLGVCSISQFVIGVWMHLVRAQMNGKPIEEYAADDPLKIQFDTLHNYSEWLLMAGMIAALIAFFLIANRKAGVTAKGSEITNDPFDFTKEFRK